MGFFDEVAGALGANVGGTAGVAGLAQQLLEQSGGVQGLMQKFEQSGLGDIAASWVANGENQPISADQISQLLADHGLDDVIAKTGMDPQQASELLAQHLPGLINHLTPTGDTAGANLAEEGLSLLKGFFGK